MSSDFLPVHLIQTFVAFAESTNITEAAENLGMSQPAVSVHLKKLEDLTPHPVFTMHGKRKVLSAYGQSLYQSLSPTFHQMKKSLAEVNNQFGDLKNRTLKIGGRREVLTQVLDDFKFEGTIQYLNMETSETIEALLTHQIDLAITNTSPDTNELIAKRLFTESIELRVHKKLIPNKKDWHKDKEWLSTTPFLAYRSHPPFLSEWLRYTKSKEPKFSFVIEDWLSISELVNLGKGYSLVPSKMPKSKDVIAVEIPSGIIKNISFYLLYHQQMKKSDWLKGLLK